MRHTLAALTFLALLAAPALAGVADLERNLGATAIDAAGAPAASAPPAALGTIEEILKATDAAIQEILSKGNVTAEDLARVDRILSEGVKAVERLRAAGGAANPDAATAGGGAPGDPGAAAEVGIVDVDTRLNVRDGAWGSIIGKLGDNEQVEILGQEGDWLRIKFNGGVGYVHSRYVARNGRTPGGPEPSNETYRGHVKTRGGNLNVRSAPWGPIIGSLNSGAALNVIGREGDWCVIEYDGGRAYVHSDYVGRGDAPPADPGHPGAPDPGVPQGVAGFVFPVGVGNCRFTDTWGAARSGGRRHEGTDIFNQRNSPLVACRNGRVGSTSPNSLGGNCVRVEGDDGVRYYYAHLERVGDVRPGQPIRSGAVVGYMGNTGNAASTPVHLHFGAYRNNTAFNPYPILHSSYRWGRH